MLRREFLQGLPLLGLIAGTPIDESEIVLNDAKDPLAQWRIKVNDIIMIVEMVSKNERKIRDYDIHKYAMTPVNGPMKGFRFETVSGLREIDDSVRWIGLIAAKEPVEGLRWQSRYIPRDEMLQAKIDWDLDWTWGAKA